MGYKEELKQFDQSMFPDYQGNSMARSTENLQLVELYRYWGSVGLFSFYVLLIILSFVAICCKSKVIFLDTDLTMNSFHHNQKYRVTNPGLG